MNLKSKLARLSTRGLADPTPHYDVAPAPALSPEPFDGDASQTQAGVGAERSRALQLRQRIDAMRLARPAKAPIALQGGGWLQNVIETPAGPLCQILSPHPHDFQQGHMPLAPCLTVSSAQLVSLTLDAGMAHVDSRKLLFVDTETTGLAGGAGTVPFLIGVGYFVDDALIIEQWMLRHMGEQVPMLARLAELLEAADAIVTYNGKSFDWPLLRNRFILNRVKMPAPKPHIDLLHCTRRLLKQRAPEGSVPKRGGLRLSNVERDVMGFTRVGDIDGAHIPERFFAYLRGEPAALLDCVIEHNRHDLVSLAALLGYAGHRLDDIDVDGSADEHLNLAHIALRGRHTKRAIAFAERASRTPLGHVRAEAALMLARMRIKERAFEEAACVLRAGLDTNKQHGLLQAALHLALAKLLEHRLRDIAGALVHGMHTQRAEGQKAHSARMARLGRKALRQTTGVVDPARACAQSVSHVAIAGAQATCH